MRPQKVAVQFYNNSRERSQVLWTVFRYVVKLSWLRRWLESGKEWVVLGEDGQRMTTAVRRRYHEWQPVIPSMVLGTRILQLEGWSAERVGDRFPRVSFGCSVELNCFFAQIIP